MAKRDANEDFNILAQFIQWAEVQGEEAENFVKEIMTRRGHKPVLGWRNDEGEGDKKEETNNVLGINFGGQKKASGGSNWQYGG